MKINFSKQLPTIPEDDETIFNTVVINFRKAAVVPTSVENKPCSALIDTGASRSCMSEAQFVELQLPPITKLLHTGVRTASGGNLEPLGVVTCSLKLGGDNYKSDFIVCKKLKRPMIIGIDFLFENKIGIDWSEKGHFELKKEGKILVESIEAFHSRNTIRTQSKLTIPARTIAVLNVQADMEEEEEDGFYEIKVNELFEDENPNLISIPTMHKTEKGKPSEIPHVLVNLDYDEVKIDKGAIIGFIEPTEVTIDEITTETTEHIYMNYDGTLRGKSFAQEVATEQINDISYSEDLTEGTLGTKFIISPADIETHRRVELKDAEVKDETKESLETLCEEFTDVFSKDSADIGRTPLIEMEINTGDSPPVSQKPYNLPLKHVEWVQRELQTLEEAGVIKRSVSPWASPIVIVPKKSEPGEPPRR